MDIGTRLQELEQRVGLITVQDELMSRLLTTGMLRCHYGTAAERARSTDYQESVFWWESDNHDLYQGTGSAWQMIGGASGAAPGTHAATHQNTGADEISVAALSGLLADDQHVLDAEAIAAVEGEATLDLTGDVTIAAAKSLAVDTIAEKTAAAGVTIDSVLLKDGVVAIGDVAFDDATSDPAATAAASADGTENSVARKDHAHALHAHAASHTDGTDDVQDATNAVKGLATAAQITKLEGIATGADVTANNAPQAHKDSHDPGAADALDTAAAAEISVVVAAGEGTATTFSRADHIHAINHAITDNHLATIDGTTNTPANLDYAKFTASGLEGKSYAEVLSDLSGTATALFDFNNQDIKCDDLFLNNSTTQFLAASASSLILQADTDDYLVYAMASNKWQLWTSATERFSVDDSAITSILNHDFSAGIDVTGDITGTESIYLTEQAAAGADTAALGQIWVKTATPNELWFTDDAGTDVQLGLGAGGGQDLATDTLWAAAGDLAKGTGDDTADILSAGASGTFLRIDGSIPYWDASGIADTNPLIVDATAGAPADDEYARFTASGLEGRTAAEVMTDLPAATLTAPGKVELATAAETTTGTDATRAVTPDGLAGSVVGKRVVYIKVFGANVNVATGDGKAYITIPTELNGMNLVDADAAVYTVSSSGTPTVQVHNLTDGSDMLSTVITVDAAEYSSYTAATPPVINGAEDDVVTGDRIRIDVDVAGTGTQGLDVILTFALP